MSIWTRISDALQALTQGEPLSAVFDRLRAAPERSVAFTIAVIALGAKMAKADGLVTRDEVTAFREVFHIAPKDEANAARVFNLARQDVAGFEDYAAKIRAMFRAGAVSGAGSGGAGGAGGAAAQGGACLCDLLEGLFHIALADGEYHPAEDEFLARVAEIFELPEAEFRALRARFVPDAAGSDPYAVLGVAPDMSLEAIRDVWKAMVRDTHPDAMLARGLPEEAVQMAEKRMVAINHAWDEISAGRKGAA